MKLDIIVIANALATLIVAGIIAWAKYREKKLTTRMFLADNPERCGNHAKRLEALEDKISKLETLTGRLEERINSLKGSIDRLNGKDE